MRFLNISGFLRKLYSRDYETNDFTKNENERDLYQIPPNSFVRDYVRNKVQILGEDVCTCKQLLYFFR